MKCYILAALDSEGAIPLEQAEGFAVCEMQCPESLVDAANTLTASWRLVETRNFWCTAESDGGIDSHDSDVFVHRIEPENLVMDKGCFVGVLVPRFKLVLLFDDPEKNVTVKAKDGFVGGWGKVEEYFSYTLRRSD